jgi:hypothetical protein
MKRFHSSAACAQAPTTPLVVAAQCPAVAEVLSSPELLGIILGGLAGAASKEVKQVRCSL